MSSGLRHVLKTRDFRERSQPAARARLGLLEKHKDYVLRARDFHKKQDAINHMKEKAAARNPDEFYFGMTHTQMEGGVHKKRVDKGVSGDELKAFKKDDATYVAMKHTMETRKIERLRSELHSAANVAAAPQNKRIVFVERDEPRVGKLAAGASAGAATAGIPMGGPASVTGAGVAGAEAAGVAAGTSAGTGGHSGGDEAVASGGKRRRDRLDPKAGKKLAVRYSELRQREVRQSKLRQVMGRIAQERALAGKGRRKKLRVKEGQPRVFKWRQERKK